MKPPQPARNNTSKKKKKEIDVEEEDNSNFEEELPEGMERITVPLRGKEDGIIFFPAELEKEEAKRAVKAAVFILNSYYELDDED